MAQGIGAGIGAGIQNDPDHDEAPGAPDMDRDETPSNVTPEEQAAYDQFMENGFKIIMGDGNEVSPKIAAHLQGQFEPEFQQVLAKVEPPLDTQSQTDNLAATTVLIVLFLQSSASDSGQDVPGYIAFEAGHDLSDALAQLTGLDERAAEMAFYRACDVYRQVSPFADQGELAQEFSTLVEAEKSGQLEKAVPGLREKLAQNQQQAPQEGQQPEQARG